MVATLSAVMLALGLIGEDSPGRSADQASLKPFAGLVGEWKGTGQPKRGSSRGNWVESGDWAWSLTRESAALAFKSPKGKYLRGATLKPGKEPGTFELEATLADGRNRRFSGKLGERNTLVLQDDKPDEPGLARITLTPLHDTRFLLLLEGRSEGPGLERLGEIGFTRQGVAFAAGESGPVCIVTEGRGTIPVTYKGKTYHVCCSGCRDLFNEDPEGVLAEAANRKK